MLCAWLQNDWVIEIDVMGELLYFMKFKFAMRLEGYYTGLILGLYPANERCHYKVTASLIGWAQN